MDMFFAAVIMLLGLIIGSFLNCLIWRLYQDESLLGRSYCPACRKMIAWYDNIPLLSFFLLRGRCRRCQGRISWQYPLVEAVTAWLFLLVWQQHAAAILAGTSGLAPFLRDVAIVIFLIVIFVYDLRWQLVPLNFIWPMSVLVLLLNLYLGVPWTAELLYGAIGGAFFLIQFLATRGRGVGEGDIWLGVFLGLAFPDWGRLLLIMVASYGIGSVVSIVLLLSHKKGWKSAIPLGPFLTLGALIALLYGEQLIAWYLGLLY